MVLRGLMETSPRSSTATTTRSAPWPEEWIRTLPSGRMRGVFVRCRTRPCRMPTRSRTRRQSGEEPVMTATHPRLRMPRSTTRREDRRTGLTALPGVNGGIQTRAGAGATAPWASRVLDDRSLGPSYFNASPTWRRSFICFFDEVGYHYLRTRPFFFPIAGPEHE